MNKLLFVPAVVFVAGGVMLYDGWTSQPPPESTLVEIAGPIVDIERIARTGWGRRVTGGESYVGHDLTMRTGEGDVVVRIPAWEGIPEDRIEDMLQVSVSGRYDPRSNVLYELGAGRNVLSTYYSSSETQRENSQRSLFLGAALLLVGAVVFGLLFTNRSKTDNLPT